MRHWIWLVTLLLISSGVAVQAKQKVTVEATSEDISEGLDLKAVANLFGQVKDLSEFEKELNSDKSHINNLDLNGDGNVDYLRVVEVEENGNQHLVLIQAVLAKDIYQDVAAIYVEKSGSDVAVQVIGDEYIYGKNYVIEPVYIYRPVIYDWFWGPSWVCYSSPWYWGYWPGWYAPYRPWGYHDYCVHIHVYHYDHPRCSYRYARAPHETATRMRTYSSRNDMAHSQAPYNTGSFSARTGKSNARELPRGSESSNNSMSRGSSSVSRGSSSVSRGGSTYGSSHTQVSRSISSNGSVSGNGRNSSSNYSGSSRGSSYSSSGSNSSRGSSSSSYSGSSRGSSYSSSSSSSSRGSSSSSYSGSSRGSSYSSSGSSSSSSSRGASSSPSSSGSRR